MANQSTDTPRNERIQALKDRGFEYACLDLEDPVLLGNLTINDFSTLRYAYLRDRKSTQDGLTIRGRYFDRDELEEIVLQTIPSVLHFYLQTRNVSRGPSAEEIFIVNDIYRSQSERDISDRLDFQAIPKTSRMQSFRYPYTPAREFIELVTEPYLFMPMPHGLKTALFLTDVMVAIEKMERTPELERYVQMVLRKAADLHVALGTQYVGIRCSDAYSNGGSDDVRKLQEQLGFDLKGYTPIRHVDAIEIFHEYGQVIKDGILSISHIADSYGIGRNTEFGAWISKEWAKVAEEIKRDNPLLRNR